jgi:hypothetical protein
VGQVPNGNIDLRWSTSPITDANFASANQVPTGATAASGDPEQVTVTGLPTTPGQTIFFAERATDDSGNTSLIARTHLTFGFLRPKSASPLRVSLVPAFTACSSSNRMHGPPLGYPSCSPPQPLSGQLTVGTPDSNGQVANAVGSVKYTVPLNDVQFAISMTDVRKKSDLSDYSGQLEANQVLRITDRRNGADADESATTVDSGFPITVPCTATASTTIGSTCAVTTTANTLVPGAVVAGKRSVWALGQVQLFDGGPDGVAATHPNTLFADQGIFIP